MNEVAAFLMANTPFITRFMFKVQDISPNSHDEEIWSVAWKGNTIVTGSLDQSVRLWNSAEQLKDPTILRSHNFAVISVDASASAKKVVSCGLDSVMNIYDGSSGKILNSVRNAPGSCYAVKFAPDGNRIGSSSKVCCSSCFCVL